MVKILIVYYSKTGNTGQMAEFVRKGVEKEGGVRVELKRVEESGIEDLLDSEGILMGSPTYYGTMSWQIKKLLDESVKYHGKLEGKVGGAFSSAGGIGGGNETTVMNIIKVLLIHGMIIPGNPKGDHYGPVAVGSPDGRSEENCMELGARTARLVKKLFT